MEHNNEGRVEMQDPIPENRMRRQKRVISSVTARHSSNLVATEANALRNFTSNSSVEIWVSNDGANCAKIVKTCTNAINDHSKSDVDRCALYASVMIAIVPGLKSEFISYFNRMGYTVIELNDEARDEAGLALHDWVDVTVVAMYFGQLVNILYKNILEAGYVAFMNRRAKAIAARAGVSETSNEFQIVLDLQSAMLIRRKVGADDAIRRAVLIAVIGNEKTPGPIGNVCNYLMEILAWSEMSAAMFILNTLLATKSPVLKDNRIISELIALAKAYNAIAKADYPQFYKILHPAEANKLLVRSKYATLVAVAQTCYSDISAAASNYQSTVPSANPTVLELVEIHRNYMRNQTQAVNNNVIDYLTSNDNLMEEIYNMEG